MGGFFPGFPETSLRAVVYVSEMTERETTHGSTQPGDAAEAAKATSFWLDAAAAFAYPLRGRGAFMLAMAAVVLTLFSWGQAFLAFIPFGFAIVLATWFSIMGYLTLFLVNVLTDTALGSDEPPDWPTGLDGAGRAVWLAVSAGVLSLGPAAGVHLAGVWGDPSWKPLVWPLLAGGLAVMPMNLLSVLLHDSPEGLSPLRTVPAIIRTLPAYLAVVVMVLVAGALGWLSAGAVVDWLGWPGVAVGVFLQLACLMVAARVLGLLYRHYRDRLGWVVQ